MMTNGYYIINMVYIHYTLIIHYTILHKKRYITNHRISLFLGNGADVFDFRLFPVSQQVVQGFQRSGPEYSRHLGY